METIQELIDSYKERQQQAMDALSDDYFSNNPDDIKQQDLITTMAMCTTIISDLENLLQKK